MSGWLQNKIKAAEQLLNVVDEAVVKAVRPGGATHTDHDPGDEFSLPGGNQGGPTSSSSSLTAATTGFIYANSSPFGDPEPPITAAPALISPAPAFELNAQSTGGQSADTSNVEEQQHDPGPASEPSQPSAAPTSISQPSTTFGPASVTPKTSVDPPPLPPSMSVGSQDPSSAVKDRTLAADLSSMNSISAPGGAASSGREAQLTRLVDQLKERLRASKVECEQLEDLLAQAEVKVEKERALLVQVRQELAAVQEGKAAMEAALNTQLNQQAIALQELVQKSEFLSRQVVQLERDLAAATESSRSMMQNKADMEGGMMEALRSQLSSVESQLEAERRAHSSTRAAASGRESELEAQLAGNGTALAEMQHSLQEAALRIRDLEDALAVAVTRRQEAEAQVQAVSKSGGGSGAGHLAAVQEEVDRLRAELELRDVTLHQSEAARLAATGEVQTLRVELDQLRADMEQATWRKEAATLEASLREAHEILYQKQAQLERLSADRAALQMRLEREVAAAKNTNDDHHALTLADGSRVGVQAEQAVVPMGTALGERYRRLAARPDNLGAALAAAGNIVDRTASITVFLLRQYPLVRLGVLAYFVLLNLYVYIITLRLQHAAVEHEPVDASVLPGHH